MPRASDPERHPGLAQQTKFRAVPRRTYSERMSETRSEIRRIVKEALRAYDELILRRMYVPAHPHPPTVSCFFAGAITEDPNAAMRWPSYWKDIVVKYHVVIEGWPHAEVPFRNLSDVSNLQKLEILLRGWQSGQIYFRRVTDLEFEQMSIARASMEASEQGADGDQEGAAWE